MKPEIFEIVIANLCIICFIILLSTIKIVPVDTVIIVDRKTHYLKTKRRGFYFINPFTDKITTKISKNDITNYYTNNFETHDGYIYRVNFFIKYHANDLDAVLEALESVRRSVDDVMNGAMYWALRNLSISDVRNSLGLVLNEMKHILISEASELEITIDNIQIANITQIPEGMTVPIFRPHTNSFSEGPIKYS